MTTTRVTARMLDQTKHEGEGVWQALSDRVAFERRYKASILQMAAKANKTIDKETGQPTEDFDWTLLNEERLAFFAWRLLRRAERPVGDFEEFIETVEEIELEQLDGDGDADPTPDPSGADPQPGTSQSSPQTSA